MGNVDWQKIEKFVEGSAKKKPSYIGVSDEEWADALEGYKNTISAAIISDELGSTENAWNLIFFSASAFCKGMERAEVKSGARTESLYPIY